jgi:hypothetical protein
MIDHPNSNLVVKGSGLTTWFAIVKKHRLLFFKTKIGLILISKHGVRTHLRSFTYLIHCDVSSIHIRKHRRMVDMS